MGMTACRTSLAVLETKQESDCTWTEILQCVNHSRDFSSVERCKHITQNVAVECTKTGSFVAERKPPINFTLKSTHYTVSVSKYSMSTFPK